MSIPTSILPICQRDDGDCGIAALATLLQKDYLEVADAGRRIGDWKCKRGLWTPEILKIAELLGTRLKFTWISALPNEAGLLGVRLPHGYHLLVLFGGTLYDPLEGRAWNAEEYLRMAHATLVAFFALFPR